MLKKNLYVILFAIVILGFILRIMTITTYDVWFDMSYSNLASQKPISWLLFSNPEADVHPFGSYFISHFWMKIFGNSPYSLSYMTLIVGVVAMFTLFFVTKKFYDDKVALVTTFLFATSVTMIKYAGQEARMYCFMIVLSMLSLYFLKEQKWLWFVLVTASMTYFHYYGVFMIIPHIILAYSLGIEWKKFVKAQFFVYVLMIPVVIYFVFQNYAIEGMWLMFPALTTLPSAFLFQIFLAGNTAFSNIHTVFPFLFFLLIMCFLVLQKYGRFEFGMLVAWFTGISVLLILGYSPLHVPYHHRFTLMFSPLIFILLGRSVATAFENMKFLGITLLVFWVSVQGFMYFNYYSNPDFELGHAANFLKPYCANHSIILHDTTYSQLPFMVYLPDCINILETNITMNELRTCGGAVVPPKFINNESLVPDFYVTALYNISLGQASGQKVFQDGVLVVIEVNKSSYRFREYNVSRDIKRLVLNKKFI